MVQRILETATSLVIRSDRLDVMKEEVSRLVSPTSKPENFGLPIARSFGEVGRISASVSQANLQTITQFTCAILFNGRWKKNLLN